jgi:protocatechuate 3,4-dioxygenase beta subunit
MHIIEPGCCTYYLTSIHFDDDPLLAREERDRVESGRGGSGLVSPERDADGLWRVTRDIHLGEGVPGYEEAPGRG